VNLEYPDLVDYIAIAAELTGLAVETIVALPNLPRADSRYMHLKPASGMRSSIPSSSTRRPSWWLGLLVTIRCRMETSARRG
jgi:hypothetical protein